MATPTYPPDLPGVSTFQLTPAAQTLASENEQGPRQFRRRSRMPCATAAVSFRFLGNDYDTFQQWYKTDLHYGHRWFTVQVPSAGGLTWHVVRFTAPPTARLNGHRSWDVSAEFELRDRAFVATDISAINTD